MYYRVRQEKSEFWNIFFFMEKRELKALIKGWTDSGDIKKLVRAVSVVDRLIEGVK